MKEGGERENSKAKDEIFEDRAQKSKAVGVFYRYAPRSNMCCSFLTSGSRGIQAFFIMCTLYWDASVYWGDVEVMHLRELSTNSLSFIVYLGSLAEPL